MDRLLTLLENGKLTPEQFESIVSKMPSASAAAGPLSPPPPPPLLQPAPPQPPPAVAAGPSNELMNQLEKLQNDVTKVLDKQFAKPKSSMQYVGQHKRTVIVDPAGNTCFEEKTPIIRRVFADVDLLALQKRGGIFTSLFVTRGNVLVPPLQRSVVRKRIREEIKSNPFLSANFPLCCHANEDTAIDALAFGLALFREPTQQEILVHGDALKAFLTKSPLQFSGDDVDRLLAMRPPDSKTHVDLLRQFFSAIGRPDVENRFKDANSQFARMACLDPTHGTFLLVDSSNPVDVARLKNKYFSEGQPSQPGGNIGVGPMPPVSAVCYHLFALLRDILGKLVSLQEHTFLETVASCHKRLADQLVTKAQMALFVALALSRCSRSNETMVCSFRDFEYLVQLHDAAEPLKIPVIARAFLPRGHELDCMERYVEYTWKGKDKARFADIVHDALPDILSAASVPVVLEFALKVIFSLKEVVLDPHFNAALTPMLMLSREDSKEISKATHWARFKDSSPVARQPDSVGDEWFSSYGVRYLIAHALVTHSIVTDCNAPSNIIIRDRVMGHSPESKILEYKYASNTLRMKRAGVQVPLPEDAPSFRATVKERSKEFYDMVYSKVIQKTEKDACATGEAAARAATPRVLEIAEDLRILFDASSLNHVEGRSKAPHAARGPATSATPDAPMSTAVSQALERLLERLPKTVGELLQSLPRLEFWAEFPNDTLPEDWQADSRACIESVRVMQKFDEPKSNRFQVRSVLDLAFYQRVITAPKSNGDKELLSMLRVMHAEQSRRPTKDTARRLKGVLAESASSSGALASYPSSSAQVAVAAAPPAPAPPPAAPQQQPQPPPPAKKAKQQKAVAPPPPEAAAAAISLGPYKFQVGQRLNVYFIIDDDKLASKPVIIERLAGVSAGKDGREFLVADIVGAEDGERHEGFKFHVEKKDAYEESGWSLISATVRTRSGRKVTSRV